ncbi:unnamed protein product [Hydatigera taeniaeformis]|uniref:E3 ubiquitin-protein ligase CBL n=1 Tax=Hydatigena taeniaeformis TaxID=6205 RepID=A0A0R3WLZ5_HYDTA|nr:unnamed protein product [Hydatigera taeniaeformis]
MAHRDSSFTEACDITEKAWKTAEAQISASGLRQRFHRQHEPMKCEKHMKDTIEQLKNLHGLLSNIHAPHRDSSLYQYFSDFRTKFFTNLTKLLGHFELYVRSGSRHFEEETFSMYTSFLYHMYVLCFKDYFSIFINVITVVVAVRSDEFWNHFRREFPDVNEEQNALIDTIGFSSPDYVSKYDLDIFTRLFGPWPFLTRIWRRLVNHPGYQKYGTFNTTFDVLDGYRTTPGSQSKLSNQSSIFIHSLALILTHFFSFSYTYRISMSRNGYWSIGYVSAEGKITQVLCFTSPMSEYLCTGKQQGLFKYPKGQACLDDLSDISNMRIKVELQRHPGEDGNLMTCKICRVNQSDTRLEPCGHFICNNCCRRIQSSALCYQCSSKILCTTPIEIQIKAIDARNSFAETDKGEQGSSKAFIGASNPNV